MDKNYMESIGIDVDESKNQLMNNDIWESVRGVKVVRVNKLRNGEGLCYVKKY